ncbi:MAG: beta-ketoacyl synthase chain length factor [Candidatus Marinarcus sp.]|uniref:beta-ketoacyl synthase chain length factor n=1 Tax=Candidatus Marinarcus sp. TaxID=3100987 RepID=UPI003AFF6282
MTINLEILNSAYLVGEKKIDNLTTKELVPKMVFRRRLTQASKLAIELINQVEFSHGRIMYGTGYGELEASATILNAIATKSGISPTDFQNSVYNTAASYSSILYNNENEIMTISCGEQTGDRLLKMGAIKALDGDEILLLATETINIENIQQINHCIDYLECAVALKVRVTQKEPTCNIEKWDESLPKSLAFLIAIAQECKKNKSNIIGITL